MFIKITWPGAESPGFYSSPIRADPFRRVKTTKHKSLSYRSGRRKAWAEGDGTPSATHEGISALMSDGPMFLPP